LYLPSGSTRHPGSFYPLGSEDTMAQLHELMWRVQNSFVDFQKVAENESGPLHAHGLLSFERRRGAHSVEWMACIAGPRCEARHRDQVSSCFLIGSPRCIGEECTGARICSESTRNMASSFREACSDGDRIRLGEAFDGVHDTIDLPYDHNNEDECAVAQFQPAVGAVQSLGTLNFGPTKQKKGNTDAHSSRPTTVMIKNIGCRCTPEQLMGHLDDAGLSGMYNRVYVPGRRKKTQDTNFGFGFVTFEHPEDVDECYRRMNGREIQFAASSRKVEVAMACIQGKVGKKRFRGRPGQEVAANAPGEQ